MSPRERRMVPGAEFRSYYGRPILKEPVWKPEVPWYFFFGGLAGASSALALGARLTGNELLARRARLVSAVALAASPPLLIADLGRPRRFLNMFRVLKPTSPMSVGSWLLGTAGGASTAAAACDVLGVLPRVGLAAEAVAGSIGPPLATYTGALVANTAVPVWHEARFELPFLFAGGSAASAGGAAAALTPAAWAEPARRLAVGGALLELGAMKLMEKRLGELVSEPYREGAGGAYARLAKGCFAGGAALTALAGRRGKRAVAGGALLAAGSLFSRFAVFKAGFQSARDPKYTIVPQRERLERGDRARSEPRFVAQPRADAGSASSTTSPPRSSMR